MLPNRVPSGKSHLAPAAQWTQGTRPLSSLLWHLRSLCSGLLGATAAVQSSSVILPGSSSKVEAQTLAVWPCEICGETAQQLSVMLSCLLLDHKYVLKATNLRFVLNDALPATLPAAVCCLLQNRHHKDYQHVLFIYLFIIFNFTLKSAVGSQL